MRIHIHIYINVYVIACDSAFTSIPQEIECDDGYVSTYLLYQQKKEIHDEQNYEPETHDELNYDMYNSGREDSDEENTYVCIYVK